MKIADGVEMLELTASMMGRASAFYPTLVWDAEVFVLIDTGYPGMFAELREAVDRTGVGFSRLNRVILTHHDIDHIGNLALIERELGQVRVLAYRDEIPYINGEKRPLKLAQMEDTLDSLPPERRGFYERLKSGFQGATAPVDEALTDDQVLPFNGGMTVIHTPGHTIGHLSLYLNRSKTLITGDALRVENGVLIQTPASMNHDMDSYGQSLDKLAKFEIETVVCYHGGLYRDHPSQRIAELARAR